MAKYEEISKDPFIKKPNHIRINTENNGLGSSNLSSLIAKKSQIGANINNAESPKQKILRNRIKT